MLMCIFATAKMHQSSNRARFDAEKLSGFAIAFDAHAFADGNKRTALSATAAFLNENRYLIDRTGTKDQKMLAGSIKEIAEGKKSISSTYKWLKQISIKF